MPQQYINSHIDSVHTEALTPPLQISPTAASSRTFCQLALRGVHSVISEVSRQSGVHSVVSEVSRQSALEQRRTEPSPKRARLSRPFVADATAAVTAPTDLTVDDGFVVLGSDSTLQQSSSQPQPAPSDTVNQSGTDTAQHGAAGPEQSPQRLRSEGPATSQSVGDPLLQTPVLDREHMASKSALENARSVLSEPQTLAAASSGDASAAVPSGEAEVALQPEEHLKAHLLGARAHALREARDVSAKMHAKVQQLCSEVLHDVQQSKQDLEEYPTACKPSDYSQQCVRNKLRSGLEQVARSTHNNLKSLIHASREPEQALSSAKTAQLEKIDSAMLTLEKLRAETLLVFEEAEEAEKVACEESEAAALSLAPSLECVDRFVHHLAQEVDHETRQASQVHSDKLEELKAEQLRFVNANDSPQRNPIFAKVIQDIASTERLLEEHSGRSDSQKEFLQDWKDAMAVMPAQTPLPSNPPKHWLWSRIFSQS